VHRQQLDAARRERLAVAEPLRAVESPRVHGRADAPAERHRSFGVILMVV
jgi:hypothetical protein